MNKLTVSTLRSISRLDFTDAGFPVPTGSDPDPLALEIDRAVAWLEWATGLVMDDIVVDSGPAIMWDEATQLLVEQRIIHRTDDYVSAIHSDATEITVTGYSEKRIANKDRVPVKGMITYLAELDELLWMLMTDDKRYYWLNKVGAENLPAEAISYFNDDGSFQMGYDGTYGHYRHDRWFPCQ